MQRAFETAVACFRAHAAQQLGVSGDTLQVTPLDEETADENRSGDLWRFDANLDGKHVRGWASPDGRVVTLQQDLGRFLHAAGAWTRQVNSRTLAEHLTWALGIAFKLHDKRAAPRLELEDGQGMLVWVVTYRPPGPGGGAGGGPEDLRQVTVTLSSDHQATLDVRPLQSS